MILWQKQASAKWLAENEARLHEIAGPHLAIIERPGRTRALVEVNCPRATLAAELERSFGGRSKTLPRNWWKNLQAQSTHAPIRIGRRLEIVSELARAPHQLFIPAAGAFGTGEHATTAMSLRLLEETTRRWTPGWRLLDAGTGSGILALAARRFGAGEILGLDLDPRAIANARQNARLNHIGRAKFEVADVLQWKNRERYDAITANLFSELLIAALPIFARALRSAGCLIVSGILREQAEAVSRALPRAGFQLEKKRRRGKWVALQCRSRS